MTVETKTRGTVEISEKQQLLFPQGLLGFEDCTGYALIESEYEPFYWLQSLQDRNLAFLVVDPFLIRKDYEADIDDRALERIDSPSAEDLLVLAILTVPQGNGPVTVNLQGPLVINKRTNRCFQAVLGDPRWTTRHHTAPDKQGLPC
ncbi:MAG: flagellar assembly protein FliW [Treponema sp.]|jgi:flagellar assembly factor FliW|nr:flagellar assembly protein FliW [Treponema sp.]